MKSGRSLTDAPEESAAPIYSMKEEAKSGKNCSHVGRG